jgi:hypothetical protein
MKQTLDPETRKAVDGSIAKWEAIVAGTGAITAGIIAPCVESFLRLTGVGSVR